MKSKWLTVLTICSAGVLIYFAGPLLFSSITFGSYENNDFFHVLEYNPGSLIYLLIATLIPMLMSLAAVFTSVKSKNVFLTLSLILLAWFIFVPTAFSIVYFSL
jgi:ABC-type transport system involved in multi-copper enzyme maturation permease subunit